MLRELQPIPDGPYIFLGGTCGKNDWRERFDRSLNYKIADANRMLHKSTELSIEAWEAKIRHPMTLDPRVKNWTKEIATDDERKAKAQATGLCFYLGDPSDKHSRASMYSGAEAMLYALKRPLDTAIILEVSSPWSENHDDKQRLFLAEMLNQESPETTISWSVEDASAWAAKKLLAAPRSTPSSAQDL